MWILSRYKLKFALYSFLEEDFLLGFPFVHNCVNLIFKIFVNAYRKCLLSHWLGAEKPKNAVGKARNRRVLQDIGNLVKEQAARPKPANQISHPVGRFNPLKR